MNLITNEEIEKRGRAIHGDKYDYSKVEYINAQTPVCIICPEHGEFWQRYTDHSRGVGCPKCSHKRGAKKRKERAKNEFETRGRAIHGDKYDYSKVEYIDAHTKVCIICPVHGEFWQMPNSHLNGCGCPICSNKKHKDNDIFVTDAHKVHGDKYDYSKVEYINNHTKVCIICHEMNNDGCEHGEFLQTPNSHLLGQGCPKCGQVNGGLKIRGNTEEFIEKARKIHGDKYDYSKVEYIKSNQKVCIICSEHGEFYQKPNGHLLGQGCPKCHKFSKYEMKVYEYVKTFFPTAEHAYHNKELLDKQEFDIYIPDKKVAIEIQGGQHFKPNNFFGGYDGFIYTCKNDKKKYEICQNNGIKLYYHTNLKHYPDNYLDKIYPNIDDIINEIKER